MRSWIGDYTNLDKTDPANYPFGRLKDDTAEGAGDGTRVNEALFGDWYVTMWRMMAESGNALTNGLPDNETNGYEMFDALINMIRIAIFGSTYYITNPSTTPYQCPDDAGVVIVQGTDALTQPILLPQNPRINQVLMVTNQVLVGQPFVKLDASNTSDTRPAQGDAVILNAYTTAYQFTLKYDGTGWVGLSYSGPVACPFVYINGKYIDEIIKNQVGEEMNKVDRVDITESVVVGENIFKITEEKDEISYIEYVSLVIDGIEVKRFADNITMEKGDVKEFPFNIDSVEGKKIEIEAKGYYNRL